MKSDKKQKYYTVLALRLRYKNQIRERFMKTIIYTFGLVCIMALGSQVNAQDQVISANELPATATKFIQSHFPSEKISRAEKDVDINETSYEVYFSNGVKLEFDQNGNWTEVDGKKKVSIPTAFIDKDITDYVAKNYPNARIIKIENDRTHFEVELSNGLELKFDAQGHFLRMD